MDRHVILFLFGFCIPSSFSLREFHYVNQPKNWFDAQKYCREKFTDLATITSMEHISRLDRPPSIGLVWIGLRDDPQAWKTTMGTEANSWRWAATGETSKTGYKFWSWGEPSNYAGEYCVMMKIDGTWNDLDCGRWSKFVCYNETSPNEKTYVFISTLLTWAEARDYCRQHYTDLPTIESAEDNTNVRKVIPYPNTAWIGLHRMPWTWSDNNNSLFRNWMYGEPNNYNRVQFCATENAQHEWDDVDCAIRHPFLCHKDPIVKKYIVRMEIKTDADIMDPAAQTQILQQLRAVFAGQGRTDVKLRWGIQHRKPEKKKPAEPHCILQF